MTAPSFVAASAGATDASGAWAFTCHAPGGAGRLILLHILSDGASSTTFQNDIGQTPPGTNITSLTGTANQWTKLPSSAPAVWGIGPSGAQAAFHNIYAGRSTGTSAPTISGSANTDGNDLYARFYEFLDASDGTTVDDVFENNGSFTSNTGSCVVQDNTTVMTHANIVTGGADRLCVVFVGVDNDITLGNFGAESGGDLVEAVAEYTTATGTDATLQLQIATKASAGTLSGGSINLAASANWGTIAFAIKPVASGPPPVEGSAALAGSGTLTPTGSRTAGGAAAYIGTGALSPTGRASYAGASAGVGTGTLGATGGIGVNGSAALAASATITPAGGLAVLGGASPVGMGTLTAAGSLALPGVATLGATGTLGAAGRLALAGASSPQGSATITATAIASWAGSSALVGAGLLEASGGTATTHQGAAALVAAGSLTATGGVLVPLAATLAGSGTMTATPRVAWAGAGAYGGFATITAQPAGGANGSAALVASATVAASGVLSRAGALSGVGTGTLGAAGSLALPGAYSATGTGTMGAAARLTLGGASSRLGTGTMGAAGGLAMTAAGALQGQGILGADGIVTPAFDPLDPDLYGVTAASGLRGAVVQVLEPGGVSDRGSRVVISQR